MTQDIWRTLAARGHVASLHIGRPRFEQRLNMFVDAESKVGNDVPDFGVTTHSPKEREALDRHVRAGVKVLVPAKYDRGWRSVEAGARRTLLRNASETGEGYIYAFKTPFGSFVPLDNFAKWEERITEYSQRYLSLKDDLVKNYAPVKREVLDNFGVVAGLTYTNMVKQNAAMLRGTSRKAFIERYVKAVRAAFPSAEEIEQQTYFRWDLIPIDLPEADRKAIIADAALSPDEKERIKTLNRMAEIAEKSLTTGLAQMSADVSQQLYTVVYNASEQAFRYIANGNVPPKMLDMLNRLPEQVRGLNVIDNKEIVQWAERMRSAVSAFRGQDDRADTDVLRVAVEAARDGAAKRLARYGGALRATRAAEAEEEGVSVVRRQRIAA